MAVDGRVDAGREPDPGPAGKQGTERTAVRQSGLSWGLYVVFSGS